MLPRDPSSPEHSDYLQGLLDRAEIFTETLVAQRRELAPAEFWYPYGWIANLEVINRLLTGPNRDLLRDLEPKRALDVGAADGDISFFLEQEGWTMTLIDNPPTNWNRLRGARLLKEARKSKVEIQEVDLDSQFVIPGHYDLAFFMGILYHLKNPFYVLERLSEHARYVILSTRIMRWSKPAAANASDLAGYSLGTPSRLLLEDLPVAYLLGPDECNNDRTNFWIFSAAGLRRILDRTHWDILEYLVVGAEKDADPFTPQNDARAFCLLKSRRIRG